MSFFTRVTTFDQDKPILAFPHDARFPRSAQVVKDDIQVGANGKRSLPAGFLVARVTEASVERFRPLPRVALTADATTGSAILTAGMPWVVKQGDELFVLEPHTSSAVTGTTNVTAVTYEGQTFSFTPPGGTPQDNAIAIAAFFNDQYTIRDKFTFVANDDDVWIYAKDGISLLDIELVAAGEWVTTGVQTLAFENTAVGTVSFVSTVDDSINLAANAGVFVPSGAHLTTRTINEVYGMYIHSLDFTEFKQNYDLGLLSEGRVYLGALPYWDGNIGNYLPEIIAQLKW